MSGGAGVGGGARCFMTTESQKLFDDMAQKIMALASPPSPEKLREIKGLIDANPGYLNERNEKGETF